MKPTASTTSPVPTAALLIAIAAMAVAWAAYYASSGPQWAMWGNLAVAVFILALAVMVLVSGGDDRDLEYTPPETPRWYDDAETYTIEEWRERANELEDTD